ncbi:hypothetical protein [Metarhizobium album]|uniref:hypothetical protein n=1 Tax=Metarhizobium album TaxID=2182425 RepID=UPI001403E7C1|nr:hypothetical protein [Rhizobium album]
MIPFMTFIFGWFGWRSNMGLPQIFVFNPMLTMGGEIFAPNVAERTDASECHCRKAEAPIEG